MAHFCASCGSQMADGATFCPACGTRTGGASAASAPVAAASAPAPIAAQQATGGGLADNIAGLLVYLVGILAIVFLLIEPYNKNRFVRFHCFQCLFFWAATIVVGIAVTIASMVLGMIPVVGHIGMLLLWPLVWLAIFVIWVLLMVKAYQGQEWKLPVIGNLAEKQA